MLNRAIKPCSFYKTRKNMRKNVTFALSIPLPKAPRLCKYIESTLDNEQ